MTTSLTFQLDDKLKTRLKLCAVSQGKTLKQITVEAIEAYLKENSNKNLHIAEN